MRLIFATIVAAATLSTFATPVLADGERGHGHNRGHNGDGHDNRGHGNYDNNRGNGHQGHGNRHYDNRRNGYQRPYYQQHDNRGARYWGPSARQWSRWDNNWGDPQRYARQWGFDRYDHNRGWQRGNTWYSTPNQWSDWGGWSWSFSVNNGGQGNHGGYNNNGYNNGNYNQQNAQCTTYRTHDWVNGQRATVTYVGCADRWGQVYEQPGTRRVERWGW